MTSVYSSCVWKKNSIEKGESILYVHMFSDGDSLLNVDENFIYSNKKNTTSKEQLNHKKFIVSKC